MFYSTYKNMYSICVPLYLLYGGLQTEGEMSDVEDVPTSASGIPEEKAKLLKELVFGEQKLLHGRDKVWHFCREHYPEYAISRREVDRFLKAEPIYQKTRQPPKRAHTSVMAISRPGYWSIDHTGPKPRTQDGYEYILGFVEVSSRRMFARPTRTATAEETISVLRDIIDSNKLKVTLIRSDNGSAYIDQRYVEFLKSRDIVVLYSQKHMPHENIVERYWGTLSKPMAKLELLTGSKTQWAKFLQRFVENINSTYNRSLRTSANEAQDLPPEILAKRAKRYGVMTRFNNKATALKVGDIVRRRLRKTGKFEKVKETYSDALYVVTKVVRGSDTRMVTYKIHNDSEGELHGTFNITDVILVENAHPPDRSVIMDTSNERSVTSQRELDELIQDAEETPVLRETRPKPNAVTGEYEVEEILRKRKFGRQVKYLVHWKRYPVEDSTWEVAANLGNAKELLAEFRKKERQKKKR